MWGIGRRPTLLWAICPATWLGLSEAEGLGPEKIGEGIG